MKKTLLALLIAASAVSTQAQLFRPSVVDGAVLGGVAGAVIGNNSGRHNGAQGAVIGAVAGALIGAAVDQPRTQVVSTAPVAYGPEPVYYQQQPQVVYAQPAPVVYAQPVYAQPIYVQPAPVVVYRNYGYYGPRSVVYVGGGGGWGRPYPGPYYNRGRYEGGRWR